MTISLYTIASEHKALVESLCSIQDDAQAIKDTIEAISYPLEQKAALVAYAPKMLDAEADAIENAIEEMNKRVKAKRKRADAIREYLLSCMQIADVKEIECPQFKISVKKNPVSVEIFEQALLPTKYLQRPEPKPYVPIKNKIKYDIEKGIDVPGARLTQGFRIEIK